MVKKNDKKRRTPPEEQPHVPGCGCVICKAVAAGKTREQAFAELHDREQKAMAKYGWYSHCVTCDADCPIGVNYHTHGFGESWSHPDVQVVLAIRPETAHMVMTEVADLVRAGARFAPGDESDRVIAGGYRVRFVAARETGRDVLRIIFPDEAGALDRGAMDPAYALQYAGTTGPGTFGPDEEDEPCSPPKNSD